jgi:hypothetical protein
VTYCNHLRGITGRGSHTPGGAFLREFAWDHFATLTFGYPPSPEGAIRELLDRWIRPLTRVAQRRIPCFYALERGGAGLLHLHALTAGTASLSVAQLQHAWKAGYSKIVLYDAARRAAEYVTKGVHDRCEWYDLTRRMPRRLPSAPLGCPGVSQMISQ